MSDESWTIIAVGIALAWIIGTGLDKISAQLERLIGIAHRIRINDRERDF